jgi:hypothetical protein
MQAALLGLLAFFAGLGPIWVIGETIAQGEYNQRYILIASFGAALLLASALCFVLRKERDRAILVAILVALGVSAQVYYADQFREDWETQREFYWQLAWRAPGFESNTALVTYDRLTYWTGEPLLGDAFNTLYAPRLAAPYVDLWSFELTRTKTVKTIQSRELLSNDYRGLLFSMQQPDDVVLYYKPAASCVRVLTALDSFDGSLPAELRELAQFSNTANILPAGSLPDAAVFGAEPAHDWCYFYEKADLARQQGEWQAIVDLMRSADQLGLRPLSGAEWRPFIESYARTGDWQAALDATRQAYTQDASVAGQLCALWALLPEGEDAQAAVYTELKCPSE